jgi:hypothetical protein
METLEHTRVLTDAELDLVNGGAAHQIFNPAISNALLNGVMDPWWDMVGQTGHLPTPGEH